MPVYRSRTAPNKKKMPSGKGPRRNSSRRPALVIILNILIGIFTVIFLGACFSFAKAHLEERGMNYFADKYIYREIERHEYADIVENYYYDHADILEVEPAYAEAAAIARYAEAAFRYSGYAAMGDTAAAERQRVIMDRSRSEVSTYLPELDRIDSMAGISR